MADVRLTATNPEDSSVVPVACDAAGRLLLEEPQIIEGPPGPRGEQGPPGQAGQDGDPFSGNFAGDVTFGGSASIAHDVVIGKPIAVLTSVRGVRIESGGSYNYLISNDVQAGGGTSTCYQHLLNGSQTLALNADGSASFAGNVFIGDDASINGNDGSANFSGGNIQLYPDGTAGFTATVTVSDINISSNSSSGCEIRSDGLLRAQRPSGSSSAIFQGWRGNLNTSTVFADGSATFSGNKAGFTKEGYLWCTTSRGDTVMLSFTSNGAGQWIPYTPNTRIEEIRDKLDANRGDTGEMPADTP